MAEHFAKPDCGKKVHIVVGGESFPNISQEFAKANSWYFHDKLASNSWIPWTNSGSMFTWTPRIDLPNEFPEAFRAWRAFGVVKSLEEYATVFENNQKPARLLVRAYVLGETLRAPEFRAEALRVLELYVTRNNWVTNLNWADIAMVCDRVNGDSPLLMFLVDFWVSHRTDAELVPNEELTPSKFSTMVMSRQEDEYRYVGPPHALVYASPSALTSDSRTWSEGTEIQFAYPSGDAPTEM